MRKLLVPLLLLLVATPGLAQPWEGWHGPLSDGWEELRFGMGRPDVDARLQALGLRPVPSRDETLRHEGRIDGQLVEVLTHYVDSRRSPDGELYSIQLFWNRVALAHSHVLARYDALQIDYVRRYDLPVFEHSDGSASIATGSGRMMHVYQGPQMQAILELKAPRPDHYQIHVTLDSPQLHPELPGS